MKASTVREMIFRKPGPFALQFSDGRTMDVPHPDFLSLPSEEAEALDPVAILYTPHGIRLVDLTKLVAVEIGGTEQ